MRVRFFLERFIRMGRQAERTKRRIVSAFTDLINEKKDVSKISVRSIIDRADISRSTFYTYYDGVDDLSESVAKMFGNDICELIGQAGISLQLDVDYEDIYYRILKYIKDREQLAKVILLNYSNSNVTEAISRPMRDLLAEYYKNSHPEADDMVCQNAAIFWTYGIYGLARDWVARDCKPEPNVKARILNKSIGISPKFKTDF